MERVKTITTTLAKYLTQMTLTSTSSMCNTDYLPTHAVWLAFMTKPSGQEQL